MRAAAGEVTGFTLRFMPVFDALALAALVYGQGQGQGTASRVAAPVDLAANPAGRWQWMGKR
jgi:hypothetical protein